MSVQLEAERIRNTYYYTLASDDGEPLDDIGDFTFQIPPFPYPEHNSAQRAIFTLEGCMIGDQVDGQQIGQTSFIGLDIAGLGLSGQNYNSTNAAAPIGLIELRNSNRFLIPNVYEEFDSVSVGRAGAPNAGEITDNEAIQRLTGNIDMNNPYKLLCGNPVGKTIHFKVFDDNGAEIAPNGNLNTIVKFKIEIIPDS